MTHSLIVIIKRLRLLPLLYSVDTVRFCSIDLFQRFRIHTDTAQSGWKLQDNFEVYRVCINLHVVKLVIFLVSFEKLGIHM